MNRLHFRPRVGLPCKYFRLDSFLPVCNNSNISLDGVFGDNITTFLFPSLENVLLNLFFRRKLKMY